MFKNLDLILISIILLIIVVILGIKLYEMPLLLSISVIFLTILAIPLYKRCMKSRKKYRKNTFWAKDWYESKCQYITILYGITSMSIVVFIMKKIS